MYESDIQSEVSKAVIDGEVGSLTVKITDSALSVIIDIGERDAAYTADEAREFAQNLKSISDQRWHTDNDEIVEYIRDLADVVDNNKLVEDVEEKWEGKQLDGTI